MSIIFENVSFSYSREENQIKILDSFSCQFPKSQISSIIGPSGCGKSTILKLISGILQPNDGAIKIDSFLIEKIRSEGDFGFVFQKPNLLPWLNIANNITLPLKIKGLEPNTVQLKSILKDFQLDKWSDFYPHELSGGMQQRVALARAMIGNPKILLLDEPFSQLDEILRFELLFYLRKYAKKRSITVVLVTHDVSEAVIVSDFVHLIGNRPLRNSAKFIMELSVERSLDTTNDRNFIKIVSKIRKEFYKLRMLSFEENKIK